MTMPRYGICNLPLAPVRETISHASEMKSQLLFGDIFEILDKYQNWLKIENDFDGYQGWVDEKQVMFLSEEEFAAHKADKSQFFSKGFSSVVQRHSDHAEFRLGIGCRLPFYQSGELKLGGLSYSYLAEPVCVASDRETRCREIIERAVSLINTPYLWGGKSSWGLDCSGLTQLLYRMAGVHLLRDASQQAMQGQLVNLLSEAQAGDLLFFDNSNEQIVHVGIYNGNGLILHCSGLVRIDPVDHEGIYRQDLGCYSHHLRLIRRVLE